ncbi:hypothetical protein GCM10018771_29120 [Streptomyces cellulosae]|nr:hypothetical protein GCM10018771_29120 [Streptomyces cellulosae]
MVARAVRRALRGAVVSGGCQAPRMDETEFMRGRVYGADHDDPGPREGRVYAELSGGPLDGLLLDVTDHGPAEQRHGVGLPTEIGRYGPGGRAVYAPRTAGDRVYEWRGDVP